MVRYLYVWCDRHKNSDGTYTGGNWSCWCRGVESDHVRLKWIGDALVATGWAARAEFVHIGPEMPTTPPEGANVSKVYSMFDEKTPPDRMKEAKAK